jgi:cytochrome c553
VAYKHSVLMGAGALAALLSLPVLADAKADQARAEEIVSGRCFLCHGMEGESASPVFPRLAGQHAEYLARQLADFKSGKRKSDTMKPQSEELTPAEMKALGVFFANKKATPNTPTDTEILELKPVHTIASKTEDRSCGLLSFLQVPGEAQASMSAQIFLAQPKATLPSISLRAADTPPAPLTGCTTLLAGSYWCTEVTWMAFFASTKL